jgi:hypothetical protein
MKRREAQPVRLAFAVLQHHERACSGAFACPAGDARGKQLVNLTRQMKNPNGQAAAA